MLWIFSWVECCAKVVERYTQVQPAMLLPGKCFFVNLAKFFNTFLTELFQVTSSQDKNKESKATPIDNVALSLLFT